MKCGIIGSEIFKNENMPLLEYAIKYLIANGVTEFLFSGIGEFEKICELLIRQEKENNNSIKMTLYTSLQIFKNTALDELIDNKQYVTYNVTNFDEIKISTVDYYPYFHRYDKIIEDSDLFLVDKEENYNPLSRYGLPEYFAYGKVMSEDKKIVQL